MAIPEPQLDPSIVSKAPTSAVTPGEIAQPYQMLGHALDAVGQGLEKTSESLAHQAGLKAVTRDADGNPVIEHAPIIGPAANAYAHAVKFAALAEAEGDLRRSEIQLREKFRDDPQGYMQAADAKKQAVIDQYTKAGGAELGLAVGKGLEGTITQTFKGLQNEKERLDLARSVQSIDAGLEMKRNDLVALARQGGTDTPEYQGALSDYQTLLQQKVSNPRLAYPQEKADYDLSNLKGELGAGSFLHKIDTIYKDQSVDENGKPVGGPRAALAAAEAVRTDRSLNLTEQQRESYYHKAVGEIHANEAIKRQDLQEARYAWQDLRAQSALGYRISPQDVELAAEAFRQAGAPGQAAAVYAHASRMPLGDEFGRQPIATQTQQFRDLHADTGAGFRPEVQSALSKASAATGVPVSLLNRFARVESSGRPGPEADTGSYKGLLNLSHEEFNKYVPGGNIYSAEDNALAGARKIAAESKEFESKHGRQPTDTEIYLMHNQGVGGLDAHMSHPQMTAWQNLVENTAEYRRRGPERAREAIWGNIPDNMKPMFGDVDHVTSQDMLNVWHAKIEGGKGSSRDNPMQAQWQIINKGSELDKELQGTWKTLVTDWEKSKIRPSDQSVSQIVDGAKATGNVDLLERIANDSQRWETTQYLGTRPLPEQHATETQAAAAGAAGALRPAQHAALHDWQDRTDAIEKGLKDNPIATTVVNFKEQFPTPAPINVQDHQALISGLQYRQKISQFASDNWKTTPVSALDKADRDAVVGALDATNDPRVKAQIFQGLVAGLTDEKVRGATFAKLGENRPDLLTSAWAGSMMTVNEGVAQSIISGQHAAKTEPRFLPVGASEKDSYHDELDKQLPSTIFSQEARTNQTGAYATVKDVVSSLYAKASADAGDTKGAFVSDRLRTAVSQATGGIGRLNGGSFIMPKYGMTQSQFDGVMRGLNDNDLQGVTTLGGEKISADYLRGNGRLESVGDGRYRVNFAKGDQPIYAFTKPEMGAPVPFILNLRNRTSVPSTWQRDFEVPLPGLNAP